MAEVEQTMRLLLLQIQRPHAQIRLGVLKVIVSLTDQNTLQSAECPEKLVLRIREALLLQLQVAVFLCLTQ